MTKEKLKELNELKEEIKICEVKFHTIKRYEGLNGRNIRLGSSGCDIPVVPVPDELRGVVLTLLKDHYSRKLNGLKNKFAEA